MQEEKTTLQKRNLPRARRHHEGGEITSLDWRIYRLVAVMLPI
jgi:hypothetical protein